MKYEDLQTGNLALMAKPLAVIDSRFGLLCKAMGMESPINRSGFGFDLPIAKGFLEPGEDELIVLERIFFSSSTDGTPGTTVLPVTLSYGTFWVDGLTVKGTV